MSTIFEAPIDGQRQMPELEPTTFDLPAGVARIEVVETEEAVFYTHEPIYNNLFSNAMDLAAVSGKPIIVTFEGQQFTVSPYDDRTAVLHKFGRRVPESPDAYHPPIRL